jgi:hypothetical protein
VGGPPPDQSAPRNDQQDAPADQDPGIPTPNPGPQNPQGQGQSMPQYGIKTGTSGGRPPSMGAAGQLSGGGLGNG